jgi:hypothetical protein
VAAPSSHIKIGGVWKKTNKGYVKVAGTWKPLKAAYVRVSGSWKKIYTGTIVLSNAAAVSNYDLFAAAGSPSGPVDLIFTNTGTIYSTSTAVAALSVIGFAAGSTITIINQGYIIGMGGNGGDGGSSSSNYGQPGGAGGPAISLGLNVTIDNTAGYIFGGGGGGGGFGYATPIGGGGGGGGRSYATSSGGAGGAGTPSGLAGGNGTTAGAGAGGTNGYGNDPAGAGGDWGSAGVTPWYYPGAGGPGGKAIALNGYSVTWTAGNNSTQVKGAVS